MPRIVPFEECVARPGSLLIDHLIQVQQSMIHFFQNDKAKPIRLIGLAGLCHDLAKSHARWQAYIKNTEIIKKGPNHSACGAFFFSYLGYHLLQETDTWEEHHVYWLWLLRDIADHHSRLDSLHSKSWLSRYDWEMFDLSGIERFIHSLYHELTSIPFYESELEKWIDTGEEVLEEALDTLYLGYQDRQPLSLMKDLQSWRNLTTSLISGDRFDVQSLNTQWLQKAQHLENADKIRQYCEEHRYHSLSPLRIKAQKDIMEQLEQHSNHRFYTLNMPTGYGKTMTSLKIATWFGEKQGYKKIIYVAPYLSILGQTAQVIEKALGEKPLEHHSLALLEEENQRAEVSQLAMESWAHSIICTSFQQFGKAMFPGRSQEVLRRAFLQDSVVIIDEPQIFKPESWNLFLCGLEALASLVNLKVIFLSATMPPFHFGLSQDPLPLMATTDFPVDRYSLHLLEQKDEVSLSQYLQQNDWLSQAAILNTIEDAYRVYEKIIPYHENALLIHGLMTPLHKKIQIEKIKYALTNIDCLPLCVISTQVLEAGVDVSFQHVARALPTLPSMVQAAGRVNRHQEKSEKGLLSAFPFYRHGEKDTRTSVYPKALQKITDQLLFQKDQWDESELGRLVQQYYDEMFRQNTYESGLSYIRQAYEGDWKQLSSFHPFEKDCMKLPLFVPWDPAEQDIQWLPESFCHLQKRFQTFNGKDVYERYSDKVYMSKLDFAERKQFMILFHHYVLNISIKKAFQVTSKEDFLQYRIPIVWDTEAYNSQTGLNVPFKEYDTII